MNRRLLTILVILALVAMVAGVGYLTGAEPGDDPPPVDYVELFLVGVECFGDVHPDDGGTLPRINASGRAGTLYPTAEIKFVFSYWAGGIMYGWDQNDGPNEHIVGTTYDAETGLYEAEYLYDYCQEESVWHFVRYTVTLDAYWKMEMPFPLQPVWVEIGHAVEWPPCPCDRNGHR